MNKANKKAKNRFNFIDVIITLVVLAIIAFSVYLFFGDRINNALDKQQGDESLKVRYTISMNAVEEIYLPSISVGKELFHGDTSLGIVENVEISEVERIELNERTGELVISDYPGFKKVVLTVVSKARHDNYSVKIENLTIAVGSYIEFKYPGFKSYGYITSFETFDDASSIANVQ